MAFSCCRPFELNLSHRSSLHAQQTPALLSPSATPSPSSAERHKDPSYTELEQAFMARVAARQLGKDREGGKMLPGDTLRYHKRILKSER